MLDIHALVQKLKPYLPQAKVGANRLPISPDRVVTLTEYPGQITELEDAIDVPHVQVLTRSPALDTETGRDDAHAVDAFFLDDLIRPYPLGGFLVISSGRAGGGPGYLRNDDQNRALYVCTYWLKVQR